MIFRMSANIRNRIALLCSVLVLAGAAACTRDLELVEPDGGASASLRLSTRADETYDDFDGKPDVNPYAESNEDAIDRVDIFFFKTS